MKQTVSGDRNNASTGQASVGVGDTSLHPMQLKIDGSPRQRAQRSRLAQLRNASLAKTPNGLPPQLRTGIEALSGTDMSNVVVHRNSAKPAQLNALAYAQGNEIHLGPGQERHLPHEAWHVVQQAQGRVKPTMQMRNGVPVNDDKSLEREADVMGAKAMQTKGMREGLNQSRAGETVKTSGVGQTQAPLLPVSVGTAASLAQRQARPAVVVWMVTHLVKDQNGSLFGDNWESGELDVDEGELKKGQRIIVDDEDVFMSRRGANQESRARRRQDESGLKQHKWLRVISAGGGTFGYAVYVRAETIRIEREASSVTTSVTEGTDPGLFEGLSEIYDAWAAARHRRRRSIGLKVNDDIEDDEDLSSGWNWDQFDEGLDVSGEMQNAKYRAPLSESQKQWTLRSSYRENSRSPIAYMILEERVDDDTEDAKPHLYLRWLIAHPSKGGGGGALMAAAKKILQDGNYDEIRVESAYSAVPWYVSMGFEVVTPGKVIEGVGYGDTSLSLKRQQDI
ncbi:MAG: eCIS core domain-containing protein [Dyella sp.]|uniref:eCIS core domain-containing protein n=1 Tax=Dyella sp. TaxID=1869338 RepID=UPI003F7EDF15